MNGCEFCGQQESDKWILIEDISRLFCSENHGTKFYNILKSIKFKAGWSTVEMLISKETSTGWHCKAFRGMVELEFIVTFDEKNNIEKFQPIFENEE